MDIIIRKIEKKDVNDIVDIHNSAFPNFFLTSLGARFLQLYYGCMCKSHDALTLCAVENGKVVGFAATALKSAGFNMRLIKSNIVRFIGEAAILLFTKPKALLRLAKNITKKADGKDDSGEYAELYSIGVAPNCQGKGIGGLLLAENERVLREWGGGKKTIAYNDLS